MDWYERLNDYFPEHEMKDLEQMRDLIQHKEIYHKEETDDYILMYAEFDSFIFIDYLLVNQRTRGKGVGSHVLQELKECGKLIILEVEPLDEGDQATQRRIAFYRKNGFQEADRIRYRRENEDKERFELKVFYWSPIPLPQQEVMEKMAQACEEIHNFRAQRYYGRPLADPEKVLRYKKQ